MKRLLLSCMFMLSFAALGLAQSAPLDVAAPVSKTEYAAKVKDLDNAISANKTEAAEKLFGDVNQLVNAEMKVIRYKMRDATNDADRTRYRELTQKQRTLFSNAMNIKQAGSMTENRAKLIESLNAFGATIE